MNSFPFFRVATLVGFQAQNIALAPDLATGEPDPAKFAAFLAQYPEAKKFLVWANSAPWSSSWANTQYNGIHSFWFTNAPGARHAVRWSLVPRSTVRGSECAAARAVRHRFPRRGIRQALARGPVKWGLVVTQANDGDSIDDSSQPWPQDRKQTFAGTVTFTCTTSQATGDCRDINYDPTVLPYGMEPSKDPILAARSAGYSVSFNRRQYEIGAGRAPEATGAKGDAK